MLTIAFARCGQLRQDSLPPLNHSARLSLLLQLRRQALFRPSLLKIAPDLSFLAFLVLVAVFLLHRHLQLVTQALLAALVPQ
jgi:hypothetical protein